MAELGSREEQNTINVALCADWNVCRGVVALCNSIALHNKENLDIINIYLITDGEDEAKRYQTVLASNVKEKTLQIRCIPFTERDFLVANMRVVGSQYHREYLKNVMNFSRIYLANLLPESVDWLIYLDIDMIVKGNLQCLLKEAKDACLEQKTPPFAAVTMQQGGFNAGMFVTSMQYWREKHILQVAQNRMIAHKNSKKGLFDLGSQPILQHMFPRYASISDQWNRMDLGWKPDLSQTYLQGGKIYHWNGAHKPWEKDGYFKSLWQEFDTLSSL